MALFASFVEDLISSCDRAVSGGCVLGLAVICALQYVYHLHSVRRAAELKQRLCCQIDDVQRDLRSVSRDRTLASLENQILREFAEELDLDRTLDQLTRRLMAEPKHGFAAYVSLATFPGIVKHSRGMSDKAREAMVVDRAFIKQVTEQGVVTVPKTELYGSQLYDSFTPADRSRFDQLFLIGIGDAESLVGVIVSTNLIPSGIPMDQQLELARRLRQSLTGIVKRTTALHDRERKLQSVNEVMELRSVTDQHHNSPLEMIEAFVDRLRAMADADRAVLFLITSEGKGALKPLCRCGNALPAGSAKKHADLEAVLAETAVAGKDPETFDAAKLAQIGVNSVMGSAIVAPVISPNGLAGALCLTRASKEPFSSVRPELISWAARYLSETLLRALNQAVAEWHARQDSLTDLSNRRTFDREFAAALRSAESAGSTCALLMVDIDRFKSVNDRFGHPGGDEVLRCVARVLKESVARSTLCSSATTARFGGEEFAVLLPGVASDEAGRVAETIRTAIETAPIQTQQTQVNVTVSVGVAVFPEHAQTGRELLSAADCALYQAKDAGRNRVLTASLVAAS